MNKMRSPWFQVGFLTCLSLLSNNSVSAQSISSDGTLPTPTEVTPTAAGVEINGGTTRGGNLFHSFKDFSVPSGSEAFFNNAASVVNILNRVTGGNISNIDGLLRANGSANLFLINPAGIVFGKGASLEIGGSFYGSTADSLLFPDGVEFSATDKQAEPILTINAPIGLNFRDNPQPIVNRSQAPDSSGLGLVEGFQVKSGQNLAFIGGDVSLEKGVVVAPGGRIDLGGLSAAGTVNLNSDGSFNFPEGVARSNVFLNNAIVDVSGSSEGGGFIAINANNLELKEISQLSAGIQSVGIGGDVGSSNAQAGNIFINATDKVTLDDFSSISNNVFSGDIGKPGDIDIVTNSLSLTNGSRVIASTFGNANSGVVRIKAINISANGVSQSGFTSGIFSTVEEGAIGNSGGIDLNTASLSLTNGAVISTSTFGKGKAGDLFVKANESVQVIGISEAFGLPTFLGANVNQGATGKGGNLRIDTKNLIVKDGGSLSTDTFGKGNAGNLNINVENFTVQNSQVSASTFSKGNAGNFIVNASNSVNLSGENPGGFPGGLFAQIDTEGQGKGGNLTINTKRLSVSDGSKIQVSTFGLGNAGDLTIRASDVDVFETSIDNFFSTGIFAESSLAASPNSPEISIGKGNGGNLTIETERLRIKDGGQVSASTYGLGNAGTLTVKASDSIEISGIEDANAFGSSKGGGRSVSFLAAEVKPNATGRGGNLKIETGQLTVANQGRISVASLDESGTAGKLEINANSIKLDRGTIIATTALGEGGNITFNIDNTLTMRKNSSISAKASNNANGGNITINSPDGFIVAFPNQNNDIIASAEQGEGGNIKIAAQSVFGLQERPLNSITNDINASSEFGLNGNIEIITPDVDPFQETREAPQNVVEQDEVVAGVCDANQTAQDIIDGTTNSFVVNGKGGVPPTPVEPFSAETLLINGQSIIPNGEMQSRSPLSKREPRALQEQYPPIMTDQGPIYPARGIQKNPDGTIYLTAYPTNNTQRVPSNSPNCLQ